MSKSKRIKELEIKVEAMQSLIKALILITSEVSGKDIGAFNLDAGKWYKDRSIDK